MFKKKKKKVRYDSRWRARTQADIDALVKAIIHYRRSLGSKKLDVVLSLTGNCCCRVRQRSAGDRGRSTREVVLPPRMRRSRKQGDGVDVEIRHSCQQTIQQKKKQVLVKVVLNAMPLFDLPFVPSIKNRETIHPRLNPTSIAPSSEPACLQLLSSARLSPFWQPDARPLGRLRPPRPTSQTQSSSAVARAHRESPGCHFQVLVIHTTHHLPDASDCSQGTHLEPIFHRGHAHYYYTVHACIVHERYKHSHDSWLENSLTPSPTSFSNTVGT